MKHPSRKRQAWFVLLICILLCIGTMNTSRAEDEDRLVKKMPGIDYISVAPYENKGVKTE